MNRVKASIDVEALGAMFRGLGRRYVTVKQVSFMLGVSTRTAGKILARLERLGYVRKYSERAYEVLPASMSPVQTDGTAQSTPMTAYLARPRWIDA